MGGQCEVAGGTNGGTIACVGSQVSLTISGTGVLAGFSRLIAMPLSWEEHTAPRTPGAPVQAFDTELYALEGQIFGDPDFCVLRFRSGSNLGLTSPGGTTLTDLGDGTFEVASFFDVEYEIDYEGCPGSILEGLGGTSTGTIRIQTGFLDPAPPSKVPTLSPSWQTLLALLLAITAAVLLGRGGARAQ
jgi:hypothetical protein